MKELAREIFEAHAKVQKVFLRDSLDTLLAVVQVMTEALRRERKLLLFGNGGSAADAQHLAAEFVNRFLIERKALPAVALTTDTSVLTSIANDRGYELVFSRQIEALGAPGDVAVGLSTSSTSANVLEGIRTARKEGLVTVAFAGGDGGPLLKEADYCLLVPSGRTPRIQEMHILAGHVICELVERSLHADHCQRA